MGQESTETAHIALRLIRLAIEVSLWTVVPILIVLVLAGFGASVTRSARGELALATAATAGALVVISIVAFLNLFIPIPRGTGLAAIPVGLTGLAVSARRLGISRAVLVRLLPWTLGAAAAYRLGRQGLGYDIFLYHGGILEWIAREPTPQGLGLFHSRFAFNPGLALLMAPFRTPNTDWNHHVLLEISVVVLIFIILAAVTHRAHESRDATLLGFLVGLATLSGLFLGFRDVRVGTDLAAGMTVVAAVAVAASLSRVESSADRTAASGVLVLLGVLITFAVVQKTSTAPVALLLIAPFVGQPRGGRARMAFVPMLPALAISAVTGMIVTLRAWVMSGCLAYPVSFTCAEADWAIGQMTASRESAVILSWARSGSLNHTVLSDVAWFGQWFDSLERSAAVRIAFIAIILGLAVRCLGLIVGGRRGDRLPRLLWLYSTLALVFWLVAAPDPRFGFHAFLVLGALVLAPAFTVEIAGEGGMNFLRLQKWLSPLMSVGALLVVVLVAGTGGRYFPFSGQVPHGLVAVVMPAPEGSRGPLGWEYVHPVESDQCGDAFPCAPGPRPLTVERQGSRLVFRHADR